MKLPTLGLPEPFLEFSANSSIVFDKTAGPMIERMEVIKSHRYRNKR